MSLVCLNLRVHYKGKLLFDDGNELIERMAESMKIEQMKPMQNSRHISREEKRIQQMRARLFQTKIALKLLLILMILLKLAPLRSQYLIDLKGKRSRLMKVR